MLRTKIEADTYDTYFAALQRAIRLDHAAQRRIADLVISEIRDIRSEDRGGWKADECRARAQQLRDRYEFQAVVMDAADALDYSDRGLSRPQIYTLLRPLLA